MMRKSLVLLPLLLILISCKTVIDKDPAVQNGIYVVSSDISTGVYNFNVHSGDSLGLKVYCSEESYFWEFTNIQGKQYFIRSSSNGKYLSLIKMSDGTYLVNLSDSAKEECYWIVQKYKGDKYKIINDKYRVCISLSGKYLDKERPISIMSSKNSPYEFWSIISWEE